MKPFVHPLMDTVGLPPHPLRQIYAYTRYWSRSYAISVLREAGDITQMGSPATIKTLNVHAIDRHMRDLGYKKTRIVDDDDPILFGGFKNEPDEETIYTILKSSPTMSKRQIKSLHKMYRTNGVECLYFHDSHTSRR